MCTGTIRTPIEKWVVRREVYKDREIPIDADQEWVILLYLDGVFVFMLDGQGRTLWYLQRTGVAFFFFFAKDPGGYRHNSLKEFVEVLQGHLSR